MATTKEESGTQSRPTIRKPSRRSFWIKQATLWHWVSSGICLGSMLLFTVTGITLNHAAEIPAEPQIARKEAMLPETLRQSLSAVSGEGRQAIPHELSSWLKDVFGSPYQAKDAEWSAQEIYVSLPRPGGDGWISIDREAGTAEYETSDRGWISYLNDLHKGRHTGLAWKIFIDVIAAAFLVFTATGLVLLQTHASKRPSTWPLISLGFVFPALLLLFFVHY